MKIQVDGYDSGKVRQLEQRHELAIKKYEKAIGQVSSGCTVSFSMLDFIY